MSTATIPNIFVANTIIQSATMNANFAYLISILNTNILPAVGTANSLVTTDSSGNLQAVALTTVQPLTTKGDLYTFTTVPARLPVGTDGEVLVSDSSQTTGLRWGTNGGAFPQQLYNLGLAVTASGGALTIALKQQDGTTDPSTSNSVIVGMRSSITTSGAWNVRSISTALSQVLSVQTTLGMLASQSNNLWLYTIDSDGLGTIKLGAATVRYEDGILTSTVKESNTATVTIASPGVITETGHGRINNDVVQFTTTGALPTGLSVATNYYIINATTNTYQLSISPITQTAINTSGSQSGIHTIHTAGTNIVSDAAYANVAIRLIGRAKFNLTTSGTWLTPTNISLLGQFQDRETIYSQNNANGTTPTAGGKIRYSNLLVDTHGITVFIASISDWGIVIPLTGIYKFTLLTSNTTHLGIDINGSGFNPSIGGSTGFPTAAGFTFNLNRNDIVTAVTSASVAFNSTTDYIECTYLGPTA